MIPAASVLFQMANDWMYHNCGCVDWDMIAFCWQNNFWSWDDTIDDDGNILDSVKVISVQDLQDACDYMGIEIDCINY